MQYKYKKRVSSGSNHVVSLSYLPNLCQVLLPTVFVFAGINFTMYRATPSSKRGSSSHIMLSVPFATGSATHLDCPNFPTMSTFHRAFISKSNHVTLYCLVFFRFAKQVISAARVNLWKQDSNKFPKNRLLIPLFLAPHHKFPAGQKGIHQSQAQYFKLNARLPSTRLPNTG